MLKIASALVTGATGFIGSALVQRLSAEGVSVLCLVRPESPGRSHIRNLPRVELIETENYESSALSQRLSGIQTDVVFNLASAGVAPEERDPQRLLAGNLTIVTGLVSATAAWPLRKFIHVGSCSEYATAPEGHKLTEADSLQSVSLYGAAKVCAHIYGAAFALSKGLPFLTLRLFGVFGVGEARNRLVPYLISHLQRDTPVDLTPGEQVRDLLYVDDIVEALLQGAESDRLVAGSAYNVCSGKGIRIRDLAEEVANVMNKPKSLLRFGDRPYRADESMWIVGDNKRFTAHSGWAPKISVQEGIRKMVSASGEP
jgi:UDP-glucose 4-epimerase